MDCSACSHAMTEVSLDGVQIDRCESCGGVWLDEGEAAELARSLSPSPRDELKRVKLKLLQQWKTSPQDPRPVDRKCPRCDEHMQRVHYREIPGLMVEKCPQDCGMFLDRGELEKVRLLG